MGMMFWLLMILMLAWGLADYQLREMTIKRQQSQQQAWHKIPKKPAPPAATPSAQTPAEPAAEPTAAEPAAAQAAAPATPSSDAPSSAP